MNSGLVSNETLDCSEEEFGPGNATEIIGSRPFVVAEEELGTEYTLEAREDYDWAPPEHPHQGSALVDAVNATVTPRGQRARRVTDLRPGRYRASDRSSGRGPGHRRGVDIVAADTKSVANAFNLRFGHPLLGDIETGQAFMHAIDRDAIMDSLFTESYPQADPPLSSEALGYADQSEFYKYDPEATIDLLEEAGREEGSDSIRERDGERLSLVVNEAHPQPRSAELITLAAQQLREVGIELEMSSGDRAQQQADQRDLDLIHVYHSMVGRADYGNIARASSLPFHRTQVRGV